MVLRVCYGLIVFLFFGFVVPKEGLAIDVPDKYAMGITISESASMAPLSFVGYNGEPKGMVIDLWRKWSEKTGVPVSFKLVNWAQSLELVLTGQVDVHGGLFWTVERDPLFDFSDGYLLLKTALIVLRGSPIQKFADLGSGRVGVLAKGSSEEYIRTRYPQAELVAFKTVKDSTIALKNGELEALYMDYPTVMYTSSALAAVDDFVPVEFAQEEWLRAGVAKGNEELLKLVEAGFEAISESERNEIKNRWFVEPADDSYNWVLFPVLIVFLLGGMAFWFFGNPFRSS